MRILNQFGKHSLVVASSLAISIAAIAMTSCQGRGSGLGKPEQVQTNSPKSPERVEPWTTDQLVQAGLVVEGGGSASILRRRFLAGSACGWPAATAR